MQPSMTNHPRQTEGRARQVRLEEQIDACKALLVGDVRSDRRLLERIVAAAAELDKLETAQTDES